MDAHRIGPKIGLEASTTTAFWTVERVTSGILTSRADAAICWLHEMPNIVVGLGPDGTRWKYE
jgi:ABC-type phosphate transport system permease subunit